MIKLRWWSMYLLSCSVGYLLAGVLCALGARFKHPVSVLVRAQATAHADMAAGKHGPYLAPITAVAGLALLTLLGAILVRWLA